ncbi:MAG: hypothetical protein NVS3B13_40630 [Mucilaginibacter sp.]
MVHNPKSLSNKLTEILTDSQTTIMFELTKEENELLRSQIETLKKGEYSKYLPFVFTEHGILRLSNVLKSESSVQVTIRI